MEDCINKAFEYDVKLIPLNLPNEKQENFREKLFSVPYLLYEVEQLKNGDKIVINKPGGKRDNYGRLSRHDYTVYIYNPSRKLLRLISHDEIKEDLEYKYKEDRDWTREIILGLYRVCEGQEPDDVLDSIEEIDVGIPTEAIYKVYKWIWGQEDCNYPGGEGRWLSMNGLLDHFKVKI